MWYITQMVVSATFKYDVPWLKSLILCPPVGISTKGHLDNFMLLKQPFFSVLLRDCLLKCAFL